MSSNKVSHVNMSTGPSGQDDKQLIEFAKNDCDYFIRGILNKTGEMTFSIAFFRNNYVVHNVPWELDVPSVSGDLEKDMVAEIKAKVKEKTYGTTQGGWQVGQTGGDWGWDGRREYYPPTPGAGTNQGAFESYGGEVMPPVDRKNPLWRAYLADKDNDDDWETFRRRHTNGASIRGESKETPWYERRLQHGESSKQLDARLDRERIHSASFRKGGKPKYKKGKDVLSHL